MKNAYEVISKIKEERTYRKIEKYFLISRNFKRKSVIGNISTDNTI
jgi:hypothetical protein